MAKKNKAENGLDGGEQIRRAATADEEATRTNGDRKTVCPVSREQFKRAPVVVVQFVVDGVVVASQSATPREFSTRSLGWYTGDKISIPVDGVPVKVQVGVNLTAVGSKEVA